MSLFLLLFLFKISVRIFSSETGRCHMVNIINQVKVCFNCLCSQKSVKHLFFFFTMSSQGKSNITGLDKWNQCKGFSKIRGGLPWQSSG